MARTTRSQDGMFASQGAVAQHAGSLPIYVCNTCGAEVVWATSQRTGSKYLVNVSHGQAGQRYYIGRNIHRCATQAPADQALAAEYERAIRKLEEAGDHEGAEQLRAVLS